MCLIEPLTRSVHRAFVSVYGLPLPDLRAVASGEVATPIGVSLSSCLPSYTGSTSRMKLRSIASAVVFSRARPGEANP